MNVVGVYKESGKIFESQAYFNDAEKEGIELAIQNDANAAGIEINIVTMTDAELNTAI